MNSRVWEVKVSQCNYDVGGYFALSRSLKENIKLERRAQKYLKELKSLQIKPLEIIRSKNSGTINGEEYFLEAVHPTSRKQRTTITVHEMWYIANREQDIEEVLLYESLREKLKIEKQDMIFFKWIKNLSAQLYFPLQQPVSKNKLADSNMKLSWFNIPTLKRSSSQKNASPPNLRYMPSALEARYNKLTEEKLEFCVKFSDGSLSDWDPKFFEQTYDNYLLKLLPAKRFLKNNNQRCKRSSKASLKNWAVTTPECNQELDVFERSYDELFNTHFNKLEFFKIRVKKAKRNKPIGKRIQGIWCLDKEDLKILVWNPLKKICNHTWDTIFRNETINEEVYSIKRMRLKFQKLDSSSLELIDNQRKTFGTIKLAMGSPNEKTVENTTVENATFEESERNDTTADGIGKLDPNNSILSSKVDINTSLAPQKRSFIDNELMSILATKKKFKKHREGSGNATNISSTSYLINSGTYANPQGETSVTNSVYDDNRDFSFNSSSIRHSILEDGIENKCIAVNANKMIENQKVIQSLCKNSQLNLIEQPYIGECDFIINHSTCLYKIQINQFLQLRENGPLYYDKAINDLLTEFHKVIILVEFSEILQDVDPDLFWKVRFYLLHPHIEVFFIHEDANLFIDWMKYFITKWALPYDGEKVENMACIDVLLDLGFNILLVRRIFQTYNLQEFFIAIIQEESQAVELLTISQMTRLKKLLTLEW
ncbi:AIS_HP2_G0016920.mRNA.1.CDS.1 [Saccharomyces cerevisiae]|nr:AIS_HP2_G0016920.mRNA.1.CDS.1 [Saccharomyces cerevisiae]CAI6494512.1 AIS_HP2_G0016920.mRNA.1.CDS.1 [Saccharomyces cerevisiae]